MTDREFIDIQQFMRPSLGQKIEQLVVEINNLEDMLAGDFRVPSVKRNQLTRCVYDQLDDIKELTDRIYDRCKKIAGVKMFGQADSELDSDMPSSQTPPEPPRPESADDREKLITWLCWNDRDGIYSDEDCTTEGCGIHENETLWNYYIDQVNG